MKTWLFNTMMTVVCCLVITSCATDEIPIEHNESMVPVQLTLSFSGTPTTRDVNSSDEVLDYTTEQQNRIDNAYILITDSESKLVEVIENLTITKETSSEYTLYGKMEEYQTASSIIVLANIKNQGINTNSQEVGAWLKGFVGSSIQDLYNASIYTNADTKGWDIATRAIPMWGTTTIPATVNNGTVTASCNLYRALAKVNVWVNEKKGFEGFQLDKIVVSNQLDRGYCVSGKTPNSQIDVQYTETYIPTNAQARGDVEYNCQSATTAFSDLIYLPEQLNNETQSVTLTVHYTYNGISKSKAISFSDHKWDIIRNHSYVFNISSVTPTTIECKLYYVVENWDEVTINIPDFN